MATETDQFEVIVAEALRAGPASPAWRQAIEQLKAQGAAGDEWSLLVKARERLENGREYRAVRPGSGFTRKLMQRIDETPQESSGGLRTSSFAIAAAVLLVVSIIAIFAWMLLGQSQDAQGRVDLRSTLFVSTVLSHDFDKPAPEGWTRLGNLQLVNRGGLKVTPPPTPSDHYVGGGLLLPVELSAKEAVAYEATLELSGRPGASVAQLFVSESSDFSTDRGTSPREFVAQLDQKDWRIVPADGPGAGGPAGKARSTVLRCLVSRDKCLVEQDGRVLWSGEHMLSQEGTRFLGLRIMGKGAFQRDAIAVRSVVVRKP